MRIEESISRNTQRRILEEYIASPEFCRRPHPIQQLSDELIQVCFLKDEIELGIALWALSGLRTANCQAAGAGALLSILATMRATGEIARIVAERAGNPRCRECGCSDASACPGGCRWVADDLCSACAPFLVTACRTCLKPAPGSMEQALQSGWLREGYCPGCAGRMNSGSAGILTVTESELLAGLRKATIGSQLGEIDDEAN